MLPKHTYPKLLFPSGEQKLFIESVIEKCGLDVKSLSKTIGFSPRTIYDWKSEKYNVSESAVIKFCESLNIEFPSNLDALKNNWLKAKIEICRMGGAARYKKYGDLGTAEGRRKGGSKTLKILRARGVIPSCKWYVLPKNKTVDLAEFVGIMLGDGGITEEQATVSLNSEADKQYVEFVINLGNKLFRNKPTIIKRKDSKAVDLRYSGIKLVDFLISIGLKRGNKVKQQVGVPSWVQKSNSYKIACLKGLMDTDGCVGISTHKYGPKRYIYYNPCFANRSKPLLKFVANSFRDLGLHPSVTGERVWLYNKAEVRAYFKLVGSNNVRLLKFKESIPNGSGDSSLNCIA